MEEKALTPVVGAMFLVAIGVVLAVGVGLTVSQLLPQGSSPEVSLALRAENVGENVELTVIHRGGEDLASGNLRVKAEDENGLRTVEMTWPDRLSVGENGTGSYPYGPDPGGKEIKVNVIHVPSDTILLQATALVTSGSAGG